MFLRYVYKSSTKKKHTHTHTHTMDYRTMFSNYPNIHEFLSQNPDMDVDVLVSLLQPMQYALKLNGKVVSDLEQNDSFIKIYFFASVLTRSEALQSNDS